VLAGLVVLPGCALGTEESEVTVEGHTFVVDASHGYFGEVRSLLEQSAFLPSFVECTMSQAEKLALSRNPDTDFDDFEQNQESDEILGLAGEACEVPGKDTVDPNAPDSAFVLVRALKKAKLADLLATQSGPFKPLGLQYVKCVEEHFASLSNEALAEISNEGPQRVKQILSSKAMRGC
jgi:hypothetical protein